MTTVDTGRTEANTAAFIMAPISKGSCIEFGPAQGNEDSIQQFGMKEGEDTAALVHIMRTVGL